MGDGYAMSNVPIDSRFLARNQLQSLVSELRDQQYQVIGPTIDQGAIVYRQIESVDELPRGWIERQEAGMYRLINVGDDRYFGFTIGPQSPKRFLFPPQVTVSQATRSDAGWEFNPPQIEAPRYAFLGLRACDLAAISVQDRTFLRGPYIDPTYAGRRTAAVIIAVNCTSAAPTCFCTSMGTGPRCSSGFDLALTEITDGFVIEIGTEFGRGILDRLATREPTAEELNRAEEDRRQAVEQIQRHLDTTDIRNLLLGNLNHPRWDDVAARCLSCTNCTMVCPTCFCASVEEVTDLTGEHVERQRNWDSCFNLDFSYMNGGVIRDQIRARYRQWLTHKLASWIDQFDVSGCVGCGRCITWCPVGIDLTEEVAAIRGNSK